jgi:hypothetical protein
LQRNAEQNAYDQYRQWCEALDVKPCPELKWLALRDSFFAWRHIVSLSRT